MTDDIDVVDFGIAIKNALHNAIRTYQATTDTVFFMNINSERYIDETSNAQVVFHYILTIQAIYYDHC